MLRSGEALPLSVAGSHVIEGLVWFLRDRQGWPLDQMLLMVARGQMEAATEYRKSDGRAGAVRRQ